MFCPLRKLKFAGKILFSGYLLEFSDSVTHLGYVLHCSLDDSPDIRKATLEMCKKANVVLLLFSSCDPHVKTVFFSSHCLSLYMVGYFETLRAVNLNLWKLHLIVFSGVSGGSQSVLS